MLFTGAASLGLGTAVGCSLLFAQADHHTTLPPEIVAQNYSNRATACLATDSATASESVSVTNIWSAMQSAAGMSGKNVQQLIQPATSSEQARSYLAGLLSQRCDLIVTIGPTFGHAVPDLVKADPAARFTVVDGALSSPPTSVTVLEDDGAAAAVGLAVRQLGRAR